MSDDIAQQAAALPANQRERLALIVFGAGSQVGAVTIGDMAGGNVRKGTEGQVDVSGTMHGPASGVNQGTVQLFFGATPPEDGAALLADYLVSFEADCQRLHLNRLQERRQTGAEQRAAPLPLAGGVHQPDHRRASGGLARAAATGWLPAPAAGAGSRATAVRL